MGAPHLPITSQPDPDPTWGGTQILADGILIRGFTQETDGKQIEKFLRLAQANEATIIPLAKLREERRAWNMANPDAELKKKMHPCFNQLERLLNRLQREAGIVDT